MSQTGDKNQLDLPADLPADMQETEVEQTLHSASEGTTVTAENPGSASLPARDDKGRFLPRRDQPPRSAKANSQRGASRDSKVSTRTSESRQMQSTPKRSDQTVPKQVVASHRPRQRQNESFVSRRGRTTNRERELKSRIDNMNQDIMSMRAMMTELVKTVKGIQEANIAREEQGTGPEDAADTDEDHEDRQSRLGTGSHPREPEASNTQGRVSRQGSLQLQQVMIQQMKTVDPPIFDNVGKDPWMWLLEYKDVADTNNWDEPMKLKMVRHALEKGARHWFSVTWSQESPKTWLEFEDKFKSTYINEDVEGYVRSKLSKLRQSKDQDLLDYFHNALALCIPASHVISERDKIRYIVQGMCPDAYANIKMHDPTTINRLEKLVKAWREVKSTQKKAEKPAFVDKPKEARFTADQKDSRRPASRDVECLNCDEKGHLWRGCSKQVDFDRVRARLADLKEKREKYRAFRGKQDQAARALQESEDDLLDSDIESLEGRETAACRYIKISKAPPEVDRAELRNFAFLTGKSIGKSRSAKILCRINGREEEAVVDTGAYTTVITVDIVQKTKIDLYEWEWKDVRMANGAPVKPLGWCRPNIEYRGRTHTVSAIVMEHAPDFLLGENYLHSAGLVISYPDQVVLYEDEYIKMKQAQVPIPQVSNNSKDCQVTCVAKTEPQEIAAVRQMTTSANDLFIEYYDEARNNITLNRVKGSIEKSEQTASPGAVRSRRSITIPPRSRARIEVKVAQADENRPYLINSQLTGKLIVVPGIGKRQSGVVEVYNMHSTPLTLERREIIGSISAIDECDYEAYENIEIPASLTKEQQNAVRQLLKRHEDAFVTKNEEIGLVPSITHKINTGDSGPIRSKPYRVSLTEKEKIQELINEMLSADIIRQSRSPWASPVVLVKKKGTSELRFCVDYRKLNKITVVDPYPIPNMDCVLEVLSGNNWFSKLDVKAMYWQVAMDAESREKTAFVVHCGQYEFNVMPFGLVSAPMTAMRVMNEVTQGMESNVFVFYDDMLVFTRTFEEHLKALEDLFIRLDKSNIKLNAKKCELLLKSVNYLGHVVTAEGILPDPDKIASITSFKTPKTITDARSFIGMCNFFRRFIKGFAKIAKPINDTIKTKQPFVWTQEAQEAMETLKEKLTTPPVLAHYDAQGKLTIRCDASGYGLGAVLMQESSDESKTGVIAYTSRTLSSSERNHATTHKECLAMVHAIKVWRHFVYGRHFTVITDHHALCWLMKTKDHTGQLMRWSLILQEYNFTVQYESGKQHADADCLSRNPLECEAQEENIPTWPICALTPRQKVIDKNQDIILPVFDIAREQERDLYCDKIIKILKNSSAKFKDKRKFRHFRIIDDKLYRQSKIQRNKFLLELPATMREFVLTEAHDKPSGGHFGLKRTLEAIKSRFHWPSLDKDVRQYVKSCDACQRKKSNNQRKEGFMIPMPIPHQVFEIIGVDLVGPLPVTSNGNAHIVVATCYLSKYVIAKAIKKATSDKIIEVLKSSIFYVHGMPKTVITDNGSNLISSQMREIFRLLNITQKTTCPYRPQTNGQVERYNRVLGTQLGTFAGEKPKTWDKYLDALTFAYNTTVHSAHLSTPYQLVFGREALKPIDNAIGKAPELTSQVESTRHAQEELEEARKLARALVKQGQIKSKLNYDRKRVQTEYAVGDLVLRKRPFISGEKKFEMPWIGPYKVLRKLNDVNYQIAREGVMYDEAIVHCSNLRKYCPRRTMEQKGGESDRASDESPARSATDEAPKVQSREPESSL